jgi:hypothetical protein
MGILDFILSKKKKKVVSKKVAVKKKTAKEVSTKKKAVKKKAVKKKPAKKVKIEKTTVNIKAIKKESTKKALKKVADKRVSVKKVAAKAVVYSKDIAIHQPKLRNIETINNDNKTTIKIDLESKSVIGLAFELNATNLDTKYHSLWSEIQYLSQAWVKINQEMNYILRNLRTKNLLEFKIFSNSFFLNQIRKDDFGKFQLFREICFEQILSDIDGLIALASSSSTFSLPGNFFRDKQYIQEKIQYYIEDIEQYIAQKTFPKYTCLSILYHPLDQSNEVFRRISSFSGNSTFLNEYDEILKIFILRYKDKQKFDELRKVDNVQFPSEREMDVKIKTLPNKIVLNETDQKVVDFFLRHVGIFFIIISGHYPLNHLFIAKFSQQLKWNFLSFNREIYWTNELIYEFKNRLNWGEISDNPKIPWTISLLETYTDKLVWFYLSSNTSLPWSPDLIDKFKDKWNWENISANEKIPWTRSLLEKYNDKWDWDKLSRNRTFPWSISLINQFKNKWNWKFLVRNYEIWEFDFWVNDDIFASYVDYLFFMSGNDMLPWSIEVIESYIDSWDWKELSGNRGLPWTVMLFEKFESKWDWKNLSSNSALPLTVMLIEKFESKWDWGALSKNPRLPWSLEFISKYKSRWDWLNLSSNSNLSFSLDLVDLYKEKWNWELLSYNNLEKDVLIKYADKLNWETLSNNSKIIWSDQIIEMFQDKWDWMNLFHNSKIPWTLDILLKYETSWFRYQVESDIDPHYLYDKLFKKILNKVVIEEITKSI